MTERDSATELVLADVDRSEWRLRDEPRSGERM
jgi:hypothetical protein